MSLNLSPALKNFPFLTPPPGQSSNFIDPETRGPLTITLCSICLVLMWPIVMLRLYTKTFDLRKFWWDDAACILAAIGSTSYGAAAIWSMSVLGPHGWNVKLSEFSDNFIKVEIAVFEIVYGPTLFFAKLALFLLYFRIFSLNAFLRIAVKAGIIVSGLFYAATSIVFGVQCVPRPGQSWLVASSASRCRETKMMNYIQGSFGVASDIYIFVLPFPVLWGLQMTLRKKLGISAIFFTGLLAIATSSYFLSYRIETERSDDITWTLPPCLALANIEMSLGVICSSFPYLPALLRRHGSRLAAIITMPRRLYKWTVTRSKRSSEASPEKATSSLGSNSNIHVPTGILGSITGNGRFVKSGRFDKAWRTDPQISTLSVTRVDEVEVFTGIETNRGIIEYQTQT